MPVDWRKNRGGDLEAVFMRQVSPRVQEASVSLNELSDLLGIPMVDLKSDYPVRLAYTGNWHLLVLVNSQKAIDAARPNLSELAKLNARQGVATTHLFAFGEKADPFEIYTRDFGPAVGIAEDPVTGSANGGQAVVTIHGKVLLR